MPAPKGNKFAVGNEGGRPTKYRKEFCDAIIEYFSIEPNRQELVSTGTAYDKNGDVKFEKKEYKYFPNKLPTLFRFAEKIGVTMPTLHDWVDKHEEFASAYTRARELYTHFLVENGLMGLYNSQFAIFVAKNTTDMKDKVEVEHNVSFIEAVRMAKQIRAEREQALEISAPKL